MKKVSSLVRFLLAGYHFLLQMNSEIRLRKQNWYTSCEVGFKDLLEREK